MDPVVRRSADRYVTEGDGVRTLHSFSHGVHYDPANVGFGRMVALNEEQVAPGAGYDAHRHADVEIVTWVLDGALAHRDTVGAGGTIRPGTSQRLSAGPGVEHAERNASDVEPLRFVQMVLASDHEGDPDYAVLDVHGTGLLPAVDVRADARLLVARLDGTAALALPEAPRVLVHVTAGTVRVADEVLRPGDELRAAGAGPLEVAADAPAEALVWLLG